MGASGVGSARASSFPDRIAAKSGAIIAATLLVTAAVLAAMGRSAVCRCGTVRFWQGTVQSPENSQQVTDWYSFTHVVHGLLFYLAGWLVLRRWPGRARLVLAVAIEAAWEVMENSPVVIDRYRAVTIAWGYTGDSILNSLSDIVSMVLGFLLARRLPVWGSAALGVALELFTLWAIRDNLTLNMVMLAWPVEAIRRWQAGA